MSSILHQRTTHSSLANSYPLSPRSSSSSERSFSIFSPINLLALLSLIVILGVFLPWMNIQESIFSSSKVSNTKWREYSLAEAASFVARNGTVIVCAVSQPYLPFLNNWLISLTRQKHHEKVLVIAEDYATLYKVNERWPGHAVLVPPAPDAQTAHKFGSQVWLVDSSTCFHEFYCYQFCFILSTWNDKFDCLYKHNVCVSSRLNISSHLIA